MSASTLTIEELSGKRRRLVLKGAGLPVRGAEWKSSNLVVTTNNPGNPNATQHVLGPIDQPSEWDGVWSTNQLVVSPCELFDEAGAHDIALAYELFEALDSIRLGGQLLRVTWVNVVNRFNTQTNLARSDSFKIVRVGRLCELTASVATLDLINWSARFDWAGRGVPPRRTLEFRGDDLIAAVRESIVRQDAVSRAILLADIRDQGRTTLVNQFTLGQIESLVNAPLAIIDSFARMANSISNRMRALGDLLVTARDLPAAIAGRVLDVGVNAVSVANQFVDQMSRLGPEQQALPGRVSALTRAAAYYSSVQTQAQLMAAVNQRLVMQARQRRASGVGVSTVPENRARAADILTTHIPKIGETMFSIAMRYYGADLSKELNRANGFDAYAVVPPIRFALVIPTRAALESQVARSA